LGRGVTLNFSLFYLKAYKTKPPNTALTLDRKVNLNDLLGKIKNEEVKIRLEKIDIDSFYCWDFGKKATESLGNGKIVSIFCQDEFYIGIIKIIIKDKDGEIGDFIGWSRQYENPWENFLIFENLYRFQYLSSRVISKLHCLLQKESERVTEGFYSFEDTCEIERLLGFKMQKLTSETTGKGQKIIVRKNACLKKNVTNEIKGIEEVQTRSNLEPIEQDELIRIVEEEIQEKVDSLVEWLKDLPKGGKLTISSKEFPPLSPKCNTKHALEVPSKENFGPEQPQTHPGTHRRNIPGTHPPDRNQSMQQKRADRDI